MKPLILLIVAILGNAAYQIVRPVTAPYGYIFAVVVSALCVRCR